MSRKDRLARVDREHPQLSVKRQCALLRVSRSSLNYQRKGVSEDDLALMALLDRQYLATPFYGSRRMTAWLRSRGYLVSRKRVGRLLRLMGLEAVYRKPRTSRPGLGHEVYPYLLRDVEVTRPNQVWATDITYLPMAHGFLYLVAILDWYSRCVLAWRVSNTMDPSFCVEALEEALGAATPDIFNTDQGSQFTSAAFTGVLRAHGVRISMDGKRRWVDNVFVERLWRSVKYEEVYLKAYENGREAKAGLGAYFRFYNQERPHQALGYRTPLEVYANAGAEDRPALPARREAGQSNGELSPAAPIEYPEPNAAGLSLTSP